MELVATTLLTSVINSPGAATKSLTNWDTAAIQPCGFVERDFQEQRYVSVKTAASEIPGAQRQKDKEREIYHALRIGDPENPGKKFVISLLDAFSLEGPNGRHHCFAFPVALNSIAIANEASKNDNYLFPTKIARSILTQSLLAVSYIHSCGIVHAGMILLLHTLQGCLLTWF